jgi:hypothetical protein
MIVRIQGKEIVWPALEEAKLAQSGEKRIPESENCL